MNLDIPELLIDLIFQDLAEEHDLVVLGGVLLDCVDDGRGPVANELLQAVPLVQEGVHMLLHSLTRLSVHFALFIRSSLRCENLLDELLGLPQGQMTWLVFGEGGQLTCLGR